MPSSDWVFDHPVISIIGILVFGFIIAWLWFMSPTKDEIDDDKRAH